VSKPIDKGWITLTVIRIVSIALVVLAVVLLVGAISLFHEASQYASSANAHPNAAEDQPHGLDALGAIFEGGFGFVVLIVSIGLFIVAFTMFFGTSRKLKKKAAAASQQSPGQIIAPQSPQQIAELQPTTHQEDKASETSNSGVVDSRQQ
jgi:ABC-type Fe3+ transport system permease subunit